MEILKLLVAVLVASSPGIYSLLKQNSINKANAKKRLADEEKASLDNTQKLQQIYQEIIDDVKKQSNECKEQIDKLSVKIVDLTRENEKLRKTVEDQIQKIKKLESYIETLARNNGETF